jgi:glutathione synthase/RimK-type ligase-like ATP-grasp enzyme
MLVGIHKCPYGRFSKFLERYENILDHNGIDHIRLDVCQPNFWELILKLDLFIFRWLHLSDNYQIAKTILPIIECTVGIKCFPNRVTWWHYDDKIRQHYLLKQHKFPIVDSWIFWDKQEALKWLETASVPVVFKLKGGAGSNNVILVNNKTKARKLIRIMFSRGIKSECIPDYSDIRYKYFNPCKVLYHFGGNVLRYLRGQGFSQYWQIHKNYVLFQRFLPNNDFDTRVTIIGDRAFAFRRFNRDNDFRSSGSGKINYEMDKIDVTFIKKAFEISQKLKFQSMAYDFLYNEAGEVQCCEMSYTYDDTAVKTCPGYWDTKLKWHEGHYWPQYFQLVDALKLSGLLQPDME